MFITCKLPSTDVGSLISPQSKGSDQVLIHALTPSLRCVFLFLVNIPEMVVALTVTFIGAKFLEFAPTVAELILKSVALSFISTMSNVLHTQLAPVKFLNLQKNTFFHYYSPSSATGSWMVWGSFITAFKVA